MEGFERGRNLEKIGLHAQDTAELFFTDVRVPVANRLGEEGEGFRYLVSNLPQERLSIAAAGVAAARAAYGGRWSTPRSARPSASPSPVFQNTRFRLAEMATEIEMTETFIDRCVVALNAGELTRRGGGHGQVVVHRAPEPGRRLGVQLHGGYGYMTEYPIARAYADARVTRSTAARPRS